MRRTHIVSSFGESEISNHHIVIMHKKVLEFKIPVKDLLLPQSLKPVGDLLQIKDSLVLRQPTQSLLLHPIFKVALIAKLEHQIVVVARFEPLVQMQNVGMVDFVHDEYLGVQQPLENAPPASYLFLVYPFDSEHLFRDDIVSPEHFPKLSSSQFLFQHVLSDFSAPVGLYRVYSS